jgi:hypothetical protein
MHKVYLLLRSNQQTGPYSLEELLQFDLKPYDLIWIEGRSAGWYYPQEIPALQPHLSFLKQTSAASTPAPIQESIVKQSQAAGPKTIFVSMPSNSIKDEPTPKPSFSSFSYQSETPVSPSLSSSASKDPAELKTTYAKSLDEVETDYMNWTYQKKKPKRKAVSPKGILVACLLVGVAFAGWALLQSNDENPKKTPPEQTAFLSPQNEVSANDTAEPKREEPGTKTKGNKKQQQTQTTKKQKPRLLDTRAETLIKPAEETLAMNEPQPAGTKPAAATIDENKPSQEDRIPEPVTEAPKEKKKLRDKIADLFRKKPDDKKEEARPAEEENGERRSVRREAGSNLAQMVTVKFNIPNDWMMGIKGAKATLANRSNEAIVSAVVEVVYYNDDNDVLDKRTITFGNIKGRQTQTLAVPDHQTATRLEYNVVSVTAANEPFARR